ncbi:hypothetical protein AN232_06095 [Citrobacter sp. CRE-46]|nr:hypothetical protein AN232_06095 [Citrobacter sp. CRE-46]RNW20433.1 hypothetical protein B9081_017125 [Citrobacter werkmanii]
MGFFDINTLKLIHGVLLLSSTYILAGNQYYPPVYVACAGKRHNVICITVNCLSNVTNGAILCYYAR